MKSVFLTLLIIFGNIDSLYSTTTDSLKIAYNNIDVLSKRLDSIGNKVAIFESKLNERREVKCNRSAKDFTREEWIIIFFMPGVILLFSIVLLYVLKQSPDFKFTKVIGLGNGKDEGQETQSSSRFIAILTGLTAIFVATTLVMYNGYLMVAQCNNAIDVDGLWKILAGLGIGVIPYGINVWNKNVKEETATGKTSSSTQNPKPE